MESNRTGHKHKQEIHEGVYFTSTIDAMEVAVKALGTNGYNIEVVGEESPTQAGPMQRVKVHHPVLDSEGLRPFWDTVKTFQQRTLWSSN